MSYIKYKVGDVIKGIKFIADGERSKGRARGIFQCPFCPNTFQTFVYNVSSGHATSCGCNSVAKRNEKMIKHGHCVGGKCTSEYGSYREMIDRCENPENEQYHNYGARGIYVCERWRESFSNFIEDMGLKPSKDLSIERVDNDGIYEKSNCKWATDLEQSNNTRRNVKLTFNGKTQTQSQWARELGIEETTIKGRRKRGLPIEQILSTEKQKYPSNSLFVTHNGEKVRLVDLCKEKGLNAKLVQTRMRLYGYTIEQALTKPKFSGNTTRHHKPVSNLISHSFGHINA